MAEGLNHDALDRWITGNYGEDNPRFAEPRVAAKPWTRAQADQSVEDAYDFVRDTLEEVVCDPRLEGVSLIRGAAVIEETIATPAGLVRRITLKILGGSVQVEVSST